MKEGGIYKENSQEDGKKDEYTCDAEKIFPKQTNAVLGGTKSIKGVKAIQRQPQKRE